MGGGVKTYSKTDFINDDIAKALHAAPSKSGGKGANYPDIKVLIEVPHDVSRQIPVMMEAKGTPGVLEKTDSDGLIDNVKKNGEPNFTNINKYAVNGAVHYAEAIVEHSSSYRECVAIGLNGYLENDDLKTEISVWYVDKENYSMAKKIGDYSDLSFLYPEHLQSFIKALDEAILTPAEVELQKKKLEDNFDLALKNYNQYVHDDVKISVTYRVALTTALIMAGLGVPGKVSPLRPEELTGEEGTYSNDGQKVLNKTGDFLNAKELPEKERLLVDTELRKTLILSNLEKPVNGTSKIATVYRKLYDDILPIIKSDHRIDFMGKLFNVLNEWVDVPDGEANDVVLTPRYVTDLMSKLCRVNMDSYVWDYASGSGGFLISAMNDMLKDAKQRCKSPQELTDKLDSIRTFQLLGVEKRSDIYLLHLLNMLMMDGGFQNAVCADSLTQYDGNYPYGKKKGEPFPANVFLLNPPYSAPGKGFNFVEKALSRMYTGYAAILIQENAGSGNGLPYTKRILENNTLVASIKMADIFCGKAGVQTAIYVFQVGVPHNEKQLVKFIDMSNDGYTRQNRKKSGQEVNLKNTDHAIERYQEVVNLVLYGKEYLNYYKDDCYFEDTITLEGNDWTFAQHKVIDTTPTEQDFRDTVASYLAWKISTVLKEGYDE